MYNGFFDLISYKMQFPFDVPTPNVRPSVSNFKAVTSTFKLGSTCSLAISFLDLRKIVIMLKEYRN